MGCPFHPRRNDAGDLGLCGQCVEELRDPFQTGVPVARPKKRKKAS